VLIVALPAVLALAKSRTPAFVKLMLLVLPPLMPVPLRLTDWFVDVEKE
jgi:hypothetical protein